MPHEMALYRDHLLRLDDADRRLRFGARRDDAAIYAYVSSLRPSADVVLAHFGNDLEVLGAAHIALTAARVAEFAFSVEASRRGSGIGAALFSRAILFARNRGTRTAVVYCLAANRAMRILARNAAMSVDSAAGDSEGSVDLPPPSSRSIFTEMVSEHAGLCDYALKANRKAANVWYGGLRRAA